jgi:hypothetical protein
MKRAQSEQSPDNLESKPLTSSSITPKLKSGERIFPIASIIKSDNPSLSTNSQSRPPHSRSLSKSNTRHSSPPSASTSLVQISESGLIDDTVNFALSSSPPSSVGSASPSTKSLSHSLIIESVPHQPILSIGEVNMEDQSLGFLNDSSLTTDNSPHPTSLPSPEKASAPAQTPFSLIPTPLDDFSQTSSVDAGETPSSSITANSHPTVSEDHRSVRFDYFSRFKDSFEANSRPQVFETKPSSELDSRTNEHNLTTGESSQSTGTFDPQVRPSPVASPQIIPVSGSPTSTKTVPPVSDSKYQPTATSITGVSGGRSSIKGETESQIGGILTVRFEHKETEEGHMVLTGREGRLERCEDEVSQLFR